MVLRIRWTILFYKTLLHSFVQSHSVKEGSLLVFSYCGCFVQFLIQHGANLGDACVGVEFHLSAGPRKHRRGWDGLGTYGITSPAVHYY